MVGTKSIFVGDEGDDIWTACGIRCSRMRDGRWRVLPYGDHALIFDSAVCVMDDFGTLVRVPA